MEIHTEDVFRPMGKLFDEYWDILHEATNVMSEYWKIEKYMNLIRIKKGDHDWGWQQKCQQEFWFGYLLTTGVKTFYKVKS